MQGKEQKHEKNGARQGTEAQGERQRSDAKKQGTGKRDKRSKSERQKRKGEVQGKEQRRKGKDREARKRQGRGKEEARRERLRLKTVDACGVGEVEVAPLGRYCVEEGEEFVGGICSDEFDAGFFEVRQTFEVA